jgi:hypothetical protein
MALGCKTVSLYFARAPLDIQRIQVSARVSGWSSGIASCGGRFLSPGWDEYPTGRIAEEFAICAMMTPLTIFGLFAVTAMLVCYALEARSRWFILAFAGACALGSVYGFLQGAWPFGLVEAVWSVVALRRWALAGRVK